MEILAHKFLEQHYNLSGSLKKLNAYASANYLLQTGNEKYIFKIYSSIEHLDLISSENQILHELSQASPDLNLPVPVASLNGSFELATTVDGHEYIIRLLTFIEGTFLPDIDVNEGSYESLGNYLASLDLGLLKIKNAFIQSRTSHWDIQQLHLIEEKISFIVDIPRQNIIRYFILQFNEHVRPITHQFQHSLIHNDANEWNILTEDNQVTSFIDFGDMAYAPLVQEVSIAITYAMMQSEDIWDSALIILRAYHNKLPLTKEEISTIYYFIAARLCISVSMSAYSKSLDPKNEYITISEQPAWNLLHRLIRVNPIEARNRFLTACGFQLEKRKDQLHSRQQFLSKALSLSYSSPIEMKSAAFQYMYAADGSTYLDCANNIFHVGHGHPRVIEAAQRQLARLNTNTRYLYDELNSYAENLLTKFDKRLNKVFFVNSGSAATDLALRLSRNYSQTNRTMVMDHGYHGNTAAGIDVSAYKFNGKGGTGKGAHIMIAPLPDENDKDLVLGKLVKDLESDEPIGTFIAESIVGCGGQVPLSSSYIQGLHQMIHLQGGICIADEVQTGFGRVGSHFWAYETQRLSPDIVIIGKPMGNGHPLAAVVTTNEIAEAFENGMEFFSSFGGNPVSCVIGQAVLDVIEEEELQRHAHETGNYLMDQLNNLRSDFDVIHDVRGHGLFLGIELVDENGPATGLTSKAVDKLKDKGLLLGIDGPFNNVVKFKPPMCFNKENADELVEKLRTVLHSHSST